MCYTGPNGGPMHARFFLLVPILTSMAIAKQTSDSLLFGNQALEIIENHSTLKQLFQDAKIQLVFHQKEFERASDLRNKGAVSQEELDEETRDLGIAEDALKLATAKVKVGDILEAIARQHQARFMNAGAEDLEKLTGYYTDLWKVREEAGMLEKSVAQKNYDFWSKELIRNKALQAKGQAVSAQEVHVTKEKTAEARHALHAATARADYAHKINTEGSDFLR